MTPDNFYVTGGTLQPDAPCYVKRRADTDLYQGLKQGHFCYVLTSRQMGKSSLMVHVANQLREEQATIILLDLTRLGQNVTAEQWYSSMLYLVGEQLDLEDEVETYWYGHQQVGPLVRWLNALTDLVLPSRTGQILIFVDEIDVVQSLPFSTDEFFAGLRELYNRRSHNPDLRRLSFALFGVASPSDLIRDTRLTPFNIGHRVELTDFSKEEALVLAQGLPGKQETAEHLITRIIEWTGGHPYLTQRLCKTVAEQPEVTTAQEVDRICESLFFTSRAREQDDNLLFVRERMLKSGVDLAGLLGLYGEMWKKKRIKDDETNPLIDVLRLSGISRIQETGALGVRNRIYQKVFDAEWINANMPDAEVRRQKAAFRRGMMRAAGVAFLIVAMMTALTTYAFTQKNRADLTAFALNQKSTELDRKNLELQAALEEARANATKAEAKTAEAEDQRKLAERQRADAEQQRQQVTAQKKKAEEQRQIAETQKTEAETQRREARLQLLKQYEEQARLQCLEGKFENALAYLDQVYRGGNDSSVVRFLLKQCLNQIEEVPPRRYEGHANFVESVAFSPDGSHMVTASADNTAKVWDVADKQVVLTLAGHQATVNTAEYSRDGKRVVTASYDGTAKVWDATGHVLMTIAGHQGSVTTATFDPTGKRIVTSGLDRTARVWDAVTGNLLLTITGHQGSLNSARFSPDGSQILTGSSDQTAKIWNSWSGQLMMTFAGHHNAITSAVFSPDGKIVATASADNTIRIWQVETGQVVGEFTGHKSQVNQVCFNPDGHFLVTASVDQTAGVWDVATGKLLFWFNQDHSPLLSVTFSPDGSRIATAGQDQVAFLYPIELETRNPEEITRILTERVAVRLVGERLAPNPDLTVPVKPRPTAKPSNTLAARVSGIPPLPQPLRLKTFEFETVSLDAKGEILERRKEKGQFYPEELAPGVTLEMIALSGGNLLQGSPPEEKGRSEDEGPQHEVTLDPFFISKYEVTQAQWQAVMGYNPSFFKGDNFPVDQITWAEAVEFCARLTQKTGRHYRLPTESEWEYAARAGTTTPFAFGPEMTSNWGAFNTMYPYSAAPIGDERFRTHLVGSFLPNAWGLYDMHGNVWEWCLDWFEETYYQHSPQANPHGPVTGTFRVIRGGGWRDTTVYCRSGNRTGNLPEYYSRSLGLRVVLVPR
ncbi:MAG: SUMF1/EgtB/PvdO family nonheme iron enzyme [Blastocatellia bacterium]|nr:SUMF1/EgtB/PvdO family nonheme iron enzyme [Blastocatellia bacterium]